MRTRSYDVNSNLYFSFLTQFNAYIGIWKKRTQEEQTDPSQIRGNTKVYFARNC